MDRIVDPPAGLDFLAVRATLALRSIRTKTIALLLNITGGIYAAAVNLPVLHTPVHDAVRIRTVL